MKKTANKTSKRNSRRPSKHIVQTFITRFSGRRSLIAALVILLFMSARLALPLVVKHYLLTELNSIPGYRADITSVSVALVRGTYGIHEFKFMKFDGSHLDPFITITDVEVAIDWSSLFRRQLHTSIYILHPMVELIASELPKKPKAELSPDWQIEIRKLYPFEINQLVIEHGRVSFKDDNQDIYLEEIELRAENVSNGTHSSQALPSTLLITANLLKTGLFKVKTQFNFLNEPAIGKLRADIRHLSLLELNEFAKTYGHFDFNGGEFEAFAEISATPTHYDGYVRTLFRDVRILDWSKEKKDGASLGHLIWEGVAAAIIDIFTNQRHDQFAARIPLSGPREDLEISKWQTFGSVLRNAFVKALSPRFEDKVQIKTSK